MSFIKDYVGKNLYKDVTEIADTPIDWNKFMNKTVLITGANGFIAYYLTLALLLQNDRKNLGITVMGLVRNQAKAEAKYGKILERSDLKLVSKDVCGDLSDLEHAIISFMQQVRQHRIILRMIRLEQLRQIHWALPIFYNMPAGKRHLGF